MKKELKEAVRRGEKAYREGKALEDNCYILQGRYNSQESECWESGYINEQKRQGG